MHKFYHVDDWVILWRTIGSFKKKQVPARSATLTRKFRMSIDVWSWTFAHGESRWSQCTARSVQSAKRHPPGKIIPHGSKRNWQGLIASFSALKKMPQLKPGNRKWTNENKAFHGRNGLLFGWSRRKAISNYTLNIKEKVQKLDSLQQKYPKRDRQ